MKKIKTFEDLTSPTTNHTRFNGLKTSHITERERDGGIAGWWAGGR